LQGRRAAGGRRNWAWHPRWVEWDSRRSAAAGCRSVILAQVSADGCVHSSVLAARNGPRGYPRCPLSEKAEDCFGSNRVSRALALNGSRTIRTGPSRADAGCTLCSGRSLESLEPRLSATTRHSDSPPEAAAHRRRPRQIEPFALLPGLSRRGPTRIVSLYYSPTAQDAFVIARPRQPDRRCSAPVRNSAGSPMCPRRRRQSSLSDPRRRPFRPLGSRRRTRYGRSR